MCVCACVRVHAYCTLCVEYEDYILPLDKKAELAFYRNGWNLRDASRHEKRFRRLGFLWKPLSVTSKSFFMSAGVTKIATMNDFPSHSGIYHVSIVMFPVVLLVQ